MSRRVTELTKKESVEAVKTLLKSRGRLHEKHFAPGNIVFTSYNAKDKTMTFDRTPLALVLRRGRRYSLVLNFHWLPVQMRVNLIKYILQSNKSNIENSKPLEFNYQDLKPRLKSLGYAPCIRKYINKRIGKVGVVIPPHLLMQAARMKTETFTNGKYSAEQMYAIAKRRGIAASKGK